MSDGVKFAEPTYYPIVINGRDQKMLVTVKDDGTLIYGENYHPDEAAKVFWEAMAHYFPGRKPAPEARASAEIYFAGIDDCISYLGGCTFGASEMSTVRGVLSLLKSFKRQGGYSAYRHPSGCAECDSSLAQTRLPSEDK